MRLRSFGVALAATVLSLPAFAASTPPPVPVVSGTYLLNEFHVCSSSTISPSIGQTSGTITFNAATGHGKLDATHIGGSPPVLTLQSQGGAYSNSAKHMTVAGEQFDAYYGTVTAGGVATEVNLIGIIPGSGGTTCGEQAHLSLVQ